MEVEEQDRRLKANAARAISMLDSYYPKRQLRGMWLATVANIDWPSRPGLDVATAKSEYRAWLDLAERFRHNAIVVQVRPAADAFWPSPYEPWSEWLTGNRDDADPGWDPLAFMVEEAHARNLEFHAWFNPYRASSPNTSGGNIDLLAPKHPLRRHPEWAVAYPVSGPRKQQLYFNPGMPEVRDHIQKAIMHAVENYDIDAVHFDDYFYPFQEEGADFPDDETFKKYGAGFSSKSDWRRHNVDLLVQEISLKIKDAKPWVKFGISPVSVWRNKSDDPLGSDTNAPGNGYERLSADTRKWIKEEWIDYVAPQIYTNIGFNAADYETLVPWWSDVVEGTKVHLYIGQADFKTGLASQQPAWQTKEEISRHLIFNRDYNVAGNLHFSAKHILENRIGAAECYREKHYARPALVPVMQHLPGKAPRQPTLTKVEYSNAGAKLAWSVLRQEHEYDSNFGKAEYYAIYRLDEGTAQPDAHAFSDASHLIATTRSTSYIDATAMPDKRYTYVVTALDRLHNESAFDAGSTSPQ